ncbi:Amino acid/polyamine/organocation transporter, APC superfamily [Candidatus Sulfotelmatobacter kueseliae]|uniref:Amino acid/polyamine/organocation transporter, APC superfamily n=1 Tax=Candidatus Sulfotelmatobacter kueseliae TaxID=2042962 RepID=A0A2U3KUW2_9BACT|nr:Amino acid/polyamine/organocation transporter, APC superfamily [Candidatus Sulfotelmatobacter kueseliae]
MTAPSLPLDSANQRISREPAHLPRERRITMAALACLVFFTTCGGAFGLEPLIGAVGPGLAVILILITPLVWSLPTAMMVAELTTLMPEEGGYYVWIRETFGPFWAVQQACWTMASSVVWLAMFPVLFVSYLMFLLPAISIYGAGHPGTGPVIRWLIAVLVIVAGMWLNLRGSRDVGGLAKVSTFLVLGAFALMLLVWLTRGGAPGAAVEVISRDLAANHKGVLLLGLSYVIFNYSGWDNVSTYAGEVDRPQRNYPRAIGIALLLLVLAYLLPVLAGITVTTQPAIWSSDAGWPVISQMLGGHWLRNVIAAAGLVSTWNLFSAQLLYVSRLPYVMACDGWLPRCFAKVSQETAVPKVAIFCFCAIAAVFAALSFGSLAIISCLLYAGALTLEFLSLIALRIRRPHAHRVFRVPGGWLGMAYVCVTPFAFCALVLYATLRDWLAFPGQLLVVGAVVASGVSLYFSRRIAASPGVTGGVRQP